MADCKIIQLGCSTQVNQSQRRIEGKGIFMSDYPTIEKIINEYLAQGYRIVNSIYQHDGIWFILER